MSISRKYFIGYIMSMISRVFLTTLKNKEHTKSFVEIGNKRAVKYYYEDIRDIIFKSILNSGFMFDQSSPKMRRDVLTLLI